MGVHGEEEWRPCRGVSETCSGLTARLPSECTCESLDDFLLSAFCFPAQLSVIRMFGLWKQNPQTKAAKAGVGRLPFFFFSRKLQGSQLEAWLDPLASYLLVRVVPRSTLHISLFS